MRICIVGNSHAGTLKGALSAGANAAAAEIDFFVMPGGAGPHLQIEGGRLRPAMSMTDKVFSTVPGAIADGLDLARFDAVMVCAAGLPSHRNGDPGHILNRMALGSYTQHGCSANQVVSEAVMVQVMEGVLRDSPNFNAIRLIRSVFAGQVIIQVCPLPTRALAAYRPEGDRGSNLAMQYGDDVWSFLGWYYRKQIGIIGALARELRASVIAPDASVVDAGFTPAKYGTPDPWHMNTAYGRLVLKQALAELGLLQD